MDLHLKEQRREHLWEEQKGGDDKQSCRLRMLPEGGKEVDSPTVRVFYYSFLKYCAYEMIMKSREEEGQMNVDYKIFMNI